MEQRADCEYYAPQHYRLLDALTRSPFQLKRLREITSHIVDGPFGSAIKAENYAEQGIPFIRVADVTRGEGTIKTDNLVFITQEAHEQISRSRAVPGDVIIAKTGATMGAASVLPPNIEEANIRGDLALIGSLRNPLHAHYLATYINTSIGYRLFWRLNSGSTRGRVVISNLRRLPVLWPDDETQRKVVKLINEGREAKKRKAVTAQRLLNTIDDYLLAELGITLPPEPENTITNRIFTVQRRELAGGRFDPHYNNQTNIALQMTLEAAHAVRLRSLVRLVTKGETPLWRGDNYQQEGVPFLRAQNISPDGLIGDVLKIDQAVDHRMRRSQLSGGEILYTMAGTIGIACIYAPEHGRANINQAIAKIVLNSEDETFKSYLVEILNSCICRNQALRALTVSAQPNINFEQIKSLLIPMPTDDAGLVKIVEECRKIKSEVNRLRQQAEAELEATKRRIEVLLLGEAT